MKKILNIILNIFLFFVFIWFLNNTSFANSWEILETKKEEPKTIKQLKENIEVLKSKKVINMSILQKFKIEHWELQNYFSKNLTSENFSEIENIISKYNKNKNNIKISWNNKIQKLLDLETEFFNSLLPYIDESKIELFNILKEKSLSTIKKEDEIKSEISNKKKEINNKVSIIKEKIKKNNKKQEEKINSLIKTKIKAKIFNFKNSEKFSKLSEEKQKLIFKLILKKVKEKKEKTINLTEKKLKLFNLIEEVIIEIIWNYKKA